MLLVPKPVQVKKNKRGRLHLMTCLTHMLETMIWVINLSKKNLKRFDKFCQLIDSILSEKRLQKEAEL
jgi:hypothetical protein